jgi:16S rRNA (cytosine1402-N4)-methyltransferase
MVRGEIANVAGMDSNAIRGGGEPGHLPVLVREVTDLLRPALERFQDGWIVDGTLGLGGHAAALLAAFPHARLFGIDQDPEALALAGERLAADTDRVRIRRGRMSQLASLIRDEGIGMPAACLFDVGVSSLQIDRAERGFSFQQDGPLDMRMDPARDRTAADIVNGWDETDLADLFYWEGGETRARAIARAIVAGRRGAPFLRTGALADLVARTLGRAGQGKLHPATRTFQALRRAVNEEGEELRAGLAAAEHWLAHEGRLAVISFHSGEDREAKRFLAAGAREERWRILTRKPLEAGLEERHENPRARSARLRVAERRRDGTAETDETRTARADAAAPAVRVDSRGSRGPRLHSVLDFRSRARLLARSRRIRS